MGREFGCGLWWAGGDGGEPANDPLCSSTRSKRVRLGTGIVLRGSMGSASMSCLQRVGVRRKIARISAVRG